MGGVAVWQRFLSTAVVVYGICAGAIWRESHLSIGGVLSWALVPSVVGLAVMTLWFRSAVAGAGAPAAALWTLPESAVVKTSSPPGASMQQLRSAAESMLYRVEGDLNDLLITKRGGPFLGNSVVRATAQGTDDGSTIRFNTQSAKLINNGIGRAMIYRLRSAVSASPVSS